MFLFSPVIRNISDPPSQYLVNPRELYVYHYMWLLMKVIALEAILAQRNIGDDCSKITHNVL